MITLLSLLACTPLASRTYEVCELDLEAAPSAAHPGERVELIGGPLSAQHDLYVTVGGYEAEVVDYARTDCGACDECRAVNNCQACAVCLPCEDSCTACVETSAIVVPAEVPFGETRIAMINVYGTGSTPFEVLGGDTGDTGAEATADTGTPPQPSTADTGGTDTAGPPDTDAPDTGSTEDTATATTPTADTGEGTAHTGETGATAPNTTALTADTAAP